ncbi:UNC-like C-terminal-domain-containing protein [Hyaloraphidium curvatum]|nr:UNC-like C-terminal-domain-containing protein [Hyaloraphidium curvatum]
MSTAPAPRRPARSREPADAPKPAPRARRSAREGSATPSVASVTSSVVPLDDDEPPRRKQPRQFLNTELMAELSEKDGSDSLPPPAGGPRPSAPSPRRSPAKAPAKPAPQLIFEDADDDEDDGVIVEELVEEVDVEEVVARPAVPVVEGPKIAAEKAKPTKGKGKAPARRSPLPLALLTLTALGLGSGYMYAQHAHPEALSAFTADLRSRMPEVALPDVNLPDLSPYAERASKSWDAAAASLRGGWESASLRAAELSSAAAERAAGAYGAAKEGAAGAAGGARDAAERAWKASVDALGAARGSLGAALASLAPSDASARLAELEERLKGEAASREELAGVLEELGKLQAALKTLAAREDAADATIRGVRGSVASLRSDVDGIVRRAVEELVPPMLAAKRDPATGEISVNPRLIKAIRDRLAVSGPAGSQPAGAEGAESAAPANWEQFLEANEIALQDYVRRAVADASSDVRAARGAAVLGREEVLELVREELARFAGSPGSAAGGAPAASAEELARLVDEKLRTFAADGIGRADYALASAGAKVLHDLTSPSYERTPSKPVSGLLSRLLGVGIAEGRPPTEAISKGNGMGECWAMNGSSGYITITLAAPIVPTAFTVDNVPRDVAVGWERSSRSTPRSIEAYAVYDLAALRAGLRSDPSSTEGAVLLARTEYDPGADGVRKTFEADADALERLHAELKRVGSRGARWVRFRIASNWGNPEYTCVYRLRVHGAEH